MRVLILIFLISLQFGCMQSDNSHSFDRPLTTSENSVLAAAEAVITDKCISCHTGFHNNWTSFMGTNEGWLGSGRVVAGDAASSTLIKRLINNGSTMPLGGVALTDDELAALEDWINSTDENSLYKTETELISNGLL